MGKVAVLIVLYNSENHISRLARSLLSQRDVDLLFFAFDNASTDNSLERLKALLPLTYSYKESDNKGYAYGNNHLFKRAFQYDIDFVFVINPDMDFAPSTTFLLAHALEMNPSIGAVGPVLLYGKNENRTSVVQSCGMRVNFKWRTYSALYTDTERIDLPDCDLLEVDLVNGGSVMLKKEVLCDDRVFDESYFLYGEEFDLAHSMSISGWKSAIVTNAIGWHFHDFTEANKAGNNLMYYYISRARILYFRKFNYSLSIYFSIIREVILFPLRLRWVYKLSNPRMLRFYYLGMIHGLKGKSGRADFSFESTLK